MPRGGGDGGGGFSGTRAPKLEDHEQDVWEKITATDPLHTDEGG